MGHDCSFNVLTALLTVGDCYNIFDTQVADTLTDDDIKCLMRVSKDMEVHARHILRRHLCHTKMWRIDSIEMAISMMAAIEIRNIRKFRIVRLGMMTGERCKMYQLVLEQAKGLQVLDLYESLVERTHPDPDSEYDSNPDSEYDYQSSEEDVSVCIGNLLRMLPSSVRIVQLMMHHENDCECWFPLFVSPFSDHRQFERLQKIEWSFNDTVCQHRNHKLDLRALMPPSLRELTITLETGNLIALLPASFLRSCILGNPIDDHLQFVEHNEHICKTVDVSPGCRMLFEQKTYKFFL
jgi:hypothetical protein